MKLHAFPILAALTCTALSGHAEGQTSRVMRCEVGGKVTFQQAACPPGQAASQVEVPPINVIPSLAGPAASAASGASAASAAGQGASAPRVAALPAPQRIAPEVADCLAYLRPLLRDPTSGRVLSSERDGRVLRVKLLASDARGRPQIRDAACEFVNGRVDDGWSRIQLKRLGWFAPRVLVQGNDRESRRLIRSLEESIEAQP